MTFRFGLITHSVVLIKICSKDLAKHLCNYFTFLDKMSSSIEKAEQRLNKGEHVKEDMALMLAPHANLIQQVAPTKLNLKSYT